MMAVVWNPRIELADNKIYLDDLEISFHQTVRVPDNFKSSALPPSLGRFPLYHVKDYAKTLPYTMAAKGGLFLPMYREDLTTEKWPYCWCKRRARSNVDQIQFSQAIRHQDLRWRSKYRIRWARHWDRCDKTASTYSLSQNKSIQDYLVVPDQPWIDGIATSAGKVRQFVAMPIGTGYSVEAQMTGEEVTGGIQFEVIPCASTRLQIKVAIEG